MSEWEMVVRISLRGAMDNHVPESEVRAFIAEEGLMNTIMGYCTESGMTLTEVRLSDLANANE